MYITLDSNVFFNNWYIRSAEFERLIEHANNIEATLLISQVVLDEVNSKFMEHLEVFRNDEKKLRNDHINLLPKKMDWPEVNKPKTYDLEQVLRSRFKNVEIASYDNVGHKYLVYKAIRAKLPFQKNEKGYRDALTWLSLLDFLINQPSDRRLVLVSENRHDFFAKAVDPLKLHDDLDAEWKEKGLKNELLLYDKLAKFNDEQLPPIADKLDESMFFEMHQQAIEDDLSNQIDNYYSSGQGTADFLRLLCLSSLVVQHSYWNILEGFEDTKLLRHQPISETLSYMSCSFNLRIVFVLIEVAADVV